MESSGKQSVVAARAAWLAELAQAIDDAQKLAWKLGVVEGPNPQALDLYVQLESARAEVEFLRRGGSSGRTSLQGATELLISTARNTPE